MAHARVGVSRAVASAPPFLDDDASDDDDDAVVDLALALELQRFYEAQEEQAAVDETVAYSLTMEQARRLHEEEEPDQDGKPPPHCSCCLGGLPLVTQRRVMPCGHVYCVRCVTTRCKMSVRDRAMAPAHCCKKEFPTDYVQHVLSRDEFKTYDRFVDERASGGRTDLVSDAEYAVAVAAHGWKQCPRCGVGVEKTAGCDAIRCLRGHWFCWACGRAPCECGRTNLALYQQRY